MNQYASLPVSGGHSLPESPRVGKFRKFELHPPSRECGNPNEKLKLVPSRWSHTGWRYVLDDPQETEYFSSPNRVNTFGWAESKENE